MARHKRTYCLATVESNFFNRLVLSHSNYDNILRKYRLSQDMSKYIVSSVFVQSYGITISSSSCHGCDVANILPYLFVNNIDMFIMPISYGATLAIAFATV